MNKFKRWYVTLVAGLLMALVLVACGEATATPVPTPTPVPPTATVAPTNSQAGSTGGTTVGGNVKLPAISGATELKLDATTLNEVGKQLNTIGLSLSNADLKLFVSDDDADKLATNTDTALTGAGYRFSIPGQAKPLKQGDSTAGFYGKAGESDVFFTSIPIPSDPSTLSSSLNLPGVDKATVDKLVDQIKGKKSLLLVIAAPDLLNKLLAAFASGGGGAGPNGGASVPIATPTKK